MTKKALAALTIGVALIVFLAVVSVFYPSRSPKERPGKGVEIPYRTAPEFAQKPALPGGAPPAAPAIPPASSPPAVPAPEPKPSAAPESAPPLAEPEEQYGLLVGRYRTYQEARKVMEKAQKAGKPAFIRQGRGRPKPYSVWVGPFASRDQAKLAARDLKSKLKVKAAPRPEKLPQPVPK